jgi:small subunit ribosomal protein S7
MPRSGPVRARTVEVDPVYGNALVAKLVNRSMYDGKKSVSQKEVYTALKNIKELTKEDPIVTFEKALENIRPVMEVRARRIGGAAYQVPVSVRGRRQEALSIRWLVESARSRSNSEYHTYADKLTAEIMDAAKGEGVAVKKRLDVEKVAEANKAFAHFRW